MISLEPESVWRHFDLLCSIPRASKQEAALRERLHRWALGRKLDSLVDSAGNLLIRKPGSEGREHRPALAMQAHLDMVCQANQGTIHDFSRDPIVTSVRDGWLLAENTTLGADNGIGVALALAALEDETLAHPPLEILFTIDEESGMSGAHGLAAGMLRATRMLNLDTEEWGEFYLGCAGGCDVDVAAHTTPEPVPAGWRCFTLSVTGLRGGHSGVDIHRGRGNANKLLLRLLLQWDRDGLIRLIGLAGGTARNALPREATARFAAPDEAALRRSLAIFSAEINRELAGCDNERHFDLTDSPPEAVIPAMEQRAWLTALAAAPFGVRAMSADLPGIVETSNNLGILSLMDGQLRANLMVRSLKDRAIQELADEISSLFRAAGFTALQSGFYPGWTPNPASELLALCQHVYEEEFGGKAAIQVIHAGLECGIIGAKYPGLDIVSFGPTIRGAHAPGEHVEIASVGHCWRLLRAILASL